MSIADQLYQSVDDSIKELETDLKVFEEELKATNNINLNIKVEKEIISVKKKKKFD